MNDGAILDLGECLALLDLTPVGRVVYVDTATHVRPVNFVRHDRVIYFRSGTPTPGGDQVVTFEVDHVDVPGGQGWSVILTGTARARFTESIDLELLRRLESWAPGDKHWVISIAIDDVEGRWVRQTEVGSGFDDHGYV